MIKQQHHRSVMTRFSVQGKLTVDIKENKQQYRLQDLLETAGIGYAVVNQQGFVLDANQEYVRLSGYTERDEILGRNCCEWTVERDIERYTESLAQSFTEGKVRNLELDYLHKDGKIVPIEINATLVDQEGQPVLLAMVRDNTGRVMAKKASEKVDQEWQYAMDFFEDAIYLLDMDNKVVRANKTFYDMIGRTSAQVIGHDITSILHPHGVSVPCLVCAARRENKDADVFMEAGHPNNPTGYPIHVTIKMIRDKDKNVIGVLTGIKDLRKQRKIELVLRRGKEQWEKTFDSMSDIITIQNKDMRIVRANRAAHDFFNVKAGQLNGRYCYEVFRGTDFPCPQCPELETLLHLTRHSGRITHANLNKTFQVTSDPVFDEMGNLQYVVHVAKDITEQLRLEEEIFQAQKMEAIGTLAGGIAHDFNNLLSVILGYSELAKLNIHSGIGAEGNIDNVITAGKRASTLVKQILTYSRKTELQLLPVRPHLVIDETLKLLRSTLPSTIEIEAEIDSDCGWIRADKTQLHQVMMNLCSNAVHAMQNEKGMLRVTLCRKEVYPEGLTHESGTPPGSFIVLSIGDTGHGMDEAIIKRIFDPYFTTKEVGKGTGLGLAVTQGIVKNYNGFIRVESEPGKGTVFHLHFPVLSDRDSISSEEESEDNRLFNGTERIMLVDDENTIVDVHKIMLEQMGYTVTGASNGREAFEKIRVDPDRFDLIITDMTMPHMTGLELAREVLQIRPAMPIILCSGYSYGTSEDAALSLGIKYFIAKPVMGKHLDRTIRMVLDKN